MSADVSILFATVPTPCTGRLLLTVGVPSTTSSASSASRARRHHQQHHHRHARAFDGLSAGLPESCFMTTLKGIVTSLGLSIVSGSFVLNGNTCCLMTGVLELID